MNISDKNIVLTGASSGIGAELLKLLMQYDNVKIIAVARHTETIPTREGIVFPFQADLSMKEGIDDVFDFAKSIFGKIDIFIANAGFAYMEKLSVPDWEHNQRIFSLNTLSPIYSLEKFARQNSETNQYFICNISAVAKVPLPYYSLYCSTKSAIHQFIETYRFEAKKNLQIASVYPVATRTAFFKKASQKQNPIIPFLSQDAKTVAEAIVKGIEKGKIKIYPTFLFRVFNVVGQIFPFIFKIYARREKKKAEKDISI